MHRTIAYRGFEIQIELTSAADENTFDVTFQIRGTTNLEVLGARGGRIPLRNGPLLSVGPIWWPKLPAKLQSTCYSVPSIDCMFVSRPTTRSNLLVDRA